MFTCTIHLFDDSTLPFGIKYLKIKYLKSLTDISIEMEIRSSLEFFRLKVAKSRSQSKIRFCSDSVVTDRFTTI